MLKRSDLLVKQTSICINSTCSSIRAKSVQIKTTIYVSGPGGLFDNINEYAEMFHYAAETILDNANKSSDGQLANYRHVTGK
jgi:energy-converting hydrogenase Eha subunit F